MNHLKKICLFGVIGFLSLSALIAVVSLLTGDFGETQVKVILTTLTISGLSVCAMASFAFIEKRGLAPLGGLGMGSALVAAVLGIVAIWNINHIAETYGKITLTAIIAAVAFAHAFLLHIPTVPPHSRWTQHSVILFDLLLAALVVFAIWDQTSSVGFYRFMGVITVFMVLFTLIVPICSRFTVAETAGTLALTHERDDIYRDADGQPYRVTKI